jgi:hypothetical protein
LFTTSTPALAHVLVHLLVQGTKTLAFLEFLADFLDNADEAGLAF